ncbi:hypothetical protein NP493_783g00000 [Ridgeia piscesae]|uniref:CTHRC1 C-terminal domain-containing protein n=1 Tax=Ridgeia piscesae TaxID=27915 RepID=A0AAD9KNZ3_RIDPI|nr:hypothetical protein NP493_783g00000 [Ridgeia piscesae]
MARSILLFVLLPAFIYAQSTLPKDPQCVCTVNVSPANDCVRTCDSGVSDTSVKNSEIIALQTQMQELQRELTTMTTGFGSPARMKQCSKRGMNDGKENGEIMACDFVKQRDDTVLHVAWNGDLRLIHTGSRSASCRRWFFTLNGSECSDPYTIDTQLNNNQPSMNIHRPSYVEGFCRGLSAGNVHVVWNVGDCVNQNPSYNVGDSYTGWISTVRIFVEEVNVKDATENIV